jgi:hypothetical protein
MGRPISQRKRRTESLAVLEAERARLLEERAALQAALHRATHCSCCGEPLTEDEIRRAQEEECGCTGGDERGQGNG